MAFQIWFQFSSLVHWAITHLFHEYVTRYYIQQLLLFGVVVSHSKLMQPIQKKKKKFGLSKMVFVSWSNIQITYPYGDNTNDLVQIKMSEKEKQDKIKFTHKRWWLKKKGCLRVQYKQKENRIHSHLGSCCRRWRWFR